MKKDGFWYGVLVSGLGTILALVSMSIVYKILQPIPAHASFDLNPNTGTVPDGYLDVSRSTIESISGGSYFTVDSPSVTGITCQYLPSYLGASSGWDDITDWTEPGIYTVHQWDTETCDSVEVDSHQFNLTVPEVCPFNPEIPPDDPNCFDHRVVQYGDWLIMNIFQLFLLALIAFRIVYTPFKTV